MKRKHNKKLVMVPKKYHHCWVCGAKFYDATLHNDDARVCDVCREKQYDEIKWD